MNGGPRTHSYEAMGTGWKVSVWDDMTDADFADIIEVILEDTRRFESRYSRFRKDSLVWELSGKTGTFAVPKDLVEMLRVYERLGDCSGGKCNPLVGFSLSDLGYDEAYSLAAKNAGRPTPRLRDALVIVDDETIELTRPALIDVGALGKGFFVDKVADFLRSRGVRKFLVDGSGDIVYEGNGDPIKAGLEHPDDPTKVVGVLEMTRGALCGSASNRRAWGGRHHIIDPDTLESADYVVATWVMAGTAAVADGLATCLFFCEPERFVSDWAFEYCVMNKEHKIKSSPGFPGELFGISR